MERLNVSISVPTEDRDKLVKNARGVAPAGLILTVKYGIEAARIVEDRCTVRDLEKIMTVKYIDGGQE